jgi:hypothetical protein
VSAILFRGLGAVTIWSKKPTYRTHVIQNDLPFGDTESERQGYYSQGWWHSQRVNISVGHFIGYDNPVSDLIWSELCKHFKSKELREWEENAIKMNIKPNSFLFDIDINHTLKRK